MSRFGAISSCSLLLALAAGLVSVAPAAADFEEARALTLAAEEPEDFEQAFEAVKRCADELEPACLYLSGVFYWNGWAVDRNYEKAVANFRFAASRQHVPSQLMMGHALRLGLGTVQNLEAAMDWYRRAMRSGEPVAEYAWAIIHWLGVRENGVFPRQFATLSLAPPDDLAKAVWGATGRFPGDGSKEPVALFPDPGITIAYLQMAAEKGHPRAMAVLGRSYVVGQITEEDLGRAESLLVPAAEAGDELAVRTLAGLILQKEITAPYPIPLKTLLDALAKQGREGDLTAQFFLGQFYARNDWGVQDRLQAQIWLKRAADGGVEPAQQILQALEEGRDSSGLSAAGARSVNDIREEAESGEAAAQFQMGEVHRRGLAGNQVDFAAARTWYAQAAAQGHAGALAALGTLNLYGFGKEPDVETALAQL
ncbi:MAG: hypothetical protein R3360_03250, partial [Alphaproteobacteria bacterium]|nr:hypothetical protein [Alphaproteobacteria bacterium]